MDYFYPRIFITFIVLLLMIIHRIKICLKNKKSIIKEFIILFSISSFITLILGLFVGLIIQSAMQIGIISGPPIKYLWMHSIILPLSLFFSLNINDPLLTLLALILDVSFYLIIIYSIITFILKFFKSKK